MGLDQRMHDRSVAKLYRQATVGDLLYAISVNVLDWAKWVEFSGVAQAAWFGLPKFSTPARPCW